MSEALEQLDKEQADISAKLGAEVYVGEVKAAEYKMEVEARNKRINEHIAKLLEINKKAHELLNPPAELLKEAPPLEPELTK